MLSSAVCGGWAGAALSGIGDNSGYQFSSDRAQATKAANTYYHKLVSDRRRVADRMRDVVQDAKAHGFPPARLRMAHRLDGMTPEKREKYFSDISDAAACFGMAPLSFDDDSRRNAELWTFVEALRAFRTEKQEIRTRMKDLAEQAKEAGVDFEAIRLVHTQFGRLDGNDMRMDKFDRIDALGRLLGYWE